ncbi:GumC family protein [Sphingomonas montanisoli]|uniref:Lipopolysaccharide biosynthesis protein n=1 Tax=Sphingomonas montanisoli TaxID=2606412 RepID=A0A5D9C995_9SPHN|nr:Wzz/FepE/Etk N-terminal domain-containing protein [Sphingomonas montanisoli]TZG27966.1 lipopolysaccharide biosynthesis protein [Sphingomonas montanisoli]
MTEAGLPNADQEIYEGILGYLPSILLQRKWFVLGPMFACEIAGLAFAFALPTRYQSSATIVVQSKDLPDDIANSPAGDMIDQRLAKIKQQVLSRPELIEIIQGNALYLDERRTQPLSQIIDKMRGDTDIVPVSSDFAPTARNRSNTIAFAISFTYDDPAKAQAVTQEFTQRLLRLDSSQLSNQANATVNFLRDQAQGIQIKVGEVEAQIEQIKSRNGLALSRLGGYVPNTSSYDIQISGLQRENTELMAKASGMANAGDDNLAKAEAQLAAAKALYSDNHPDVIAAEQRVIEARALAKSVATKTTPNALSSKQIADNNRAIAALNAQRSSESARANATMSAQAGAPLIEEQLRQLQGRADGFRQSYDKVQASLMAAEAAQKMEIEQRGDRLVLVDPPTLPDRPSSPNRPLLIGGGIALGTFGGVMLALLIELFMRPIRGTASLQNLLGVGPLVVIPTIRGNGRGSAPKRRWWQLFKRKDHATA